MKKNCMCGSKKKYIDCCKPLHDGLTACKTPKELLLSRYSAYALGITSYIINTTHNKFEKDINKWNNEILEFSRQYKFLGVKVYEINNLGSTAIINFKAKLQKNEKDASFTERSLFIKDNGIWYYQKSL